MSKTVGGMNDEFTLRDLENPNVRQKKRQKRERETTHYLSFTYEALTVSICSCSYMSKGLH